MSLHDELYQRGGGHMRNRNVLILGVGGIGSWAALYSAIEGASCIGLVDDDVVEMHNLNRSPFCLGDVGKKKVDVVARMILERRICNVMKIDKKTIDLTAMELRELSSLFQCIIDCRDGDDKLPKFFKRDIKLNYDGDHMTMITLPDDAESKEWGEINRHYSDTPSSLFSPSFLAMVGVYTLSHNYFSYHPRETFTFEVREIIWFLQHRSDVFERLKELDELKQSLKKGEKPKKFNTETYKARLLADDYDYEGNG